MTCSNLYRVIIISLKCIFYFIVHLNQKKKFNRCIICNLYTYLCNSKLCFSISWNKHPQYFILSLREGKFLEKLLTLPIFVVGGCETSWMLEQYEDACIGQRGVNERVNVLKCTYLLIRPQQLLTPLKDCNFRPYSILYTAWNLLSLIIMFLAHWRML